MDGFQKRTLKKRKAILDAAFRLFNRDGYKNVTIAQISKEAQVSLETIYNYFESKEKLKNEVMNQILGDFCQMTEDIMKDDIPVENKFEKLLLSKVNFGKQFSAQFLEEELKGLNGLDLMGSEEKQRFLNDMMHEIIRQGREGGIITVNVSNESLIRYIRIFQSYITHDLASAFRLSGDAGILKEVYYLFFNGMKA